MAQKKIQKNKNVIIYQAKSGAIELRGDFTRETIWATQAQIAEAFDVNVPTINEHIQNILNTGELNGKATIRNFRIVQKEGKREVDRDVKHYNLDMILSVGYRVNSKKATQFRIWATKTLKNYLVKGYAINEKRLLEAREKFNELQNAISFLQEKSKKELLTGQEGEILSLLANYAKTLTLLEEYDKGKLKNAKGARAKFILTYENCLRVKEELKKELIAKKEASNLFGQERDGGVFICVFFGQMRLSL